MRKTALFVAIVAAATMAFLAAVGSGGGTASADNGPHVSTGSDATPDKCAGCHRIHTGKNDFLLKEAGTVEQFCFSCHGDGGPGSDLAVTEGTFYGESVAGDPYGNKSASTTRGLRAGGFEHARINTTDPNNAGLPTPAPPVSIGVLATTQVVNSAHTIDGTTAGTLWGNGAIGSGPGPGGFLMECTTCHDPHGNGNYRILRSVPTGSGGAGYAIPDTYGKSAIGYTVANYFTMNQDANGDGAPDPTPAPYSGTAAPAAGQTIMVDTARWCSQCHTRYLARGGRFFPPASEASRADSGDAIFTYRHTSAGWGLRGNPTPAPAPATPGPTPGVAYNNRTCITCHTSHGSNSSMPGNIAEGTTYSASVEYPDGATPAPGDSRAAMLKMNNRGMCKKCHGAQ